MTGIDWYKEVTRPSAAPVVATPDAAPTAPKVDWYAEATGRPQQELRAAPGGFKAKPIADDATKAAPALTAARASLAPDVNDQIKRFAAARFPDLPLEAAVKRYGVVDGNIVYAGEDGNYAREVPSVTGADGVGDALSRTGKWLGAQAGPTIPAVAAGVAGAVTGATPLSIPIAGAAAGVADLARQGADRLLAGEDPTDLDYKNAAGHGLLNATGQGLGVGLVKALSKNPMGVAASDRLAALDPTKRAEVAALEAEAKKRGVDLTAGQATDMRSLKVQERQLGDKPETMDLMADFADRQRGTQVPAAVRAEIDGITGKPVGAEEGIGRFREGANAVVNNALDARSAQARVAYDKAMTAPNYYDPGLDGLMKRPSMAGAWEKAQKLAAEEGVDLPKVWNLDEAGNLVRTAESKPDWRSWDYMKRGLDKVIEENTNDLGKVNAVGRAVTNTKKELLATLDKVNPDYKAARAVYGQASDGVDAILEGGIGFLKSMDGMDRRQIVNRVFSGQNMLPEEIARMRTQFRLAGKVDDFEAGLSVWLSDKLADAMKINASGEPGNVAGKFYKTVWGDQRQQDVIRAALGPEKARSVEKLMEVLQAASRSLPENSRTARDLGAGAMESVGTGLKIAGKLASPQTYWNLGSELTEGLSALRTPGNRVKLADALTSGDYAKQLAKLRMYPPTGEKAMALAVQILTAALPGVLGARTPADRVPQIESEP